MPRERNEGTGMHRGRVGEPAYLYAGKHFDTKMKPAGALTRMNLAPAPAPAATSSSTMQSSDMGEEEEMRQ